MPKNLKAILAISAIILIVSFVLFTPFKEGYPSNRATCLANLKQMGVSLAMYTSDYNERMPGPQCRADTGHGKDGRRPTQERGGRSSHWHPT